MLINNINWHTTKTHNVSAPGRTVCLHDVILRVRVRPIIQFNQIWSYAALHTDLRCNHVNNMYVQVINATAKLVSLQEIVYKKFSMQQQKLSKKNSMQHRK